MKLTDLMISSRLAAGFAVILAMTVALGVIAESRVNDIEKSLATINDVNSVKQRFTINFRGSVHDRAIALRDVTLVEPSELSGVVDRIERLTEAYAKSAGPLDALMSSGKGVTPEEEQILSSIKETEARTLPLISEVVKLQSAGRAQDAHALLMQQARPAFVEWLARINKFIDLEEAKNKVVGAKARAVANGFLWLMLAVCGGVLALGSAVAFWSLGAIRPLSGMTLAMKRLANGDAEVAVPSLGRKDEVGAMAATLEIFKANSQERARLEREAADFQRNLDTRLKETEAAFTAASEEQKRLVEAMAVSLETLARGDLTVRLTGAFSVQYQSLQNNFNAAMVKLAETMQVVSTNASAIHSGTGEISTAADDLSRRTEQQAASLEETAAALDQITATVRKTAEGAIHAREVVGTAKGDAERSGQIVREAVTAMSGIQKSSNQISQIIGVIDEIAFQTNLLALNAGVEAARAGDAGRGFAVVASEVRALAQRSAEAAKEIKALISASGQQVSSGVDLVGEAGRALERIVTQVTEINGVVGEIAASAQEQATALNQVNTAVNQMDQVTQQNAAMVEETTAASHSLAGEAQELSRLISRFNVGAEANVETLRRPAPARAHPAARTAMRTVGHGGGAARKPAPVADEGWEEF